jgi:hypothetical protein
MLLTDGHGFPLGVETHSAAHHEVKLIKSVYRSCVYRKRKPKRLLYDRAADSKTLRWSFELDQIRLITPYRKRRNDLPRKTLNRRDQKHYSHHYKVECTFSWIKN